MFPEKHFIGLIDHPEPRIEAEDQVKIRMLEVGVCGTDRDIANFEYGSPPPGFEYFVLGHESLGEVIEAGDSARLKPGDLVVGMVRRPCPHASCHACRAGRQDFCITGDYRERGIKDLHGFMTEFLVEEERYLTKIPPELRETAVLVEPLTIAEKALLQVDRIQQRLPWNGSPPRALVLGAGPVGLLGAMVLRRAGFETFVYSRGCAPNPKAEVTEAIGAAYICSEETPVERMAAQAGNIDLVYEAMGAPQVAFEVLKYLGANGVFVFTGIPGQGQRVHIDLDTVMRNLVLKNQVVVGTVNAGQDAFEAAIRDLDAFADRWPSAVRALVTARYPIEEFQEPVFGRAHGIKNVVTL